MSPNYLAVLEAVHELHRLACAGPEESPDADAVRDAADAPWEALTEEDLGRIAAASESLYSGGVAFGNLRKPAEGCDA